MYIFQLDDARIRDKGRNVELVKVLIVLEVGSFVTYEGDDMMDYEGGSYIFLELGDSSFFFLCTFFQGFELHTRKG